MKRDSTDFQKLLHSKLEFNSLEALLGNKKLFGADFALFGEASHGTHEFYAIRSELTKELIQNRNYKSLILEADWPDMERVNHYVNAYSDDSSAEEALNSFNRFPTWMWRNKEFVELVEWIRNYNRDKPLRERVGIYGMDLFSMNHSLEIVIETITEHFPDLNFMSQALYGCFDYKNLNPQVYGQAVWLGDGPDCMKEAERMFDEIQIRRRLREKETNTPNEQEFSLEQNARVVKNSESYYRAMFRPAAISWNIRDRHMLESVRAISGFRKAVTGSEKSILWAHNSHLGDARATDMGQQGEVSLGQLMREAFGDRVFSLGFTTSYGTVVAARNWGKSAFIRKVKPPLDGSIECCFSSLDEPSFVLSLADPELQRYWPDRYLQRAIGVIYRPETERWSHYFYTHLPKQFDAVCHVEVSSAVEPLDPLTAQHRDAEMESFPSGL